MGNIGNMVKSVSKIEKAIEYIEKTPHSYLKNICNKNNMPLLILDVDETSAEANVNTRIETFFELIQSR